MHSVKRVHRSEQQKEAKRKKEASEIKEYIEIESRVLGFEITPKGNLKRQLEETTQLLEINPEHYTAWNIRRRVLSLINDNQVTQRDLGLVLALMKRFPKVYWLWNHRRWVLEQLDSTTAWEREFELVNMLLSKDPRNFHGWLYRRVVVSELEQRGQSLVESELNYTRAQTDKNFSNFSAWHYRSQLLERMEPTKVDVNLELEYARTALFMDPEDESAWGYYRWLLTSSIFKLNERAVERERQQIAELHEQEPTSTWCTLMLYMLSGDQALLSQLRELDPLRKHRYTAEIVPILG